MINLEVVGHRVLIQPEYQESEISEGALSGFQMDTGDTFKRELGATQIGTIVGVGPNAWIDFKSIDSEGNASVGRPWAKLGDRVYFAKYSGKTVKAGEVGNEVDYIICNDEDVQCIIKGDK